MSGIKHLILVGPCCSLRPQKEKLEKDGIPLLPCLKGETWVRGVLVVLDSTFLYYIWGH